MNSVDSGYTATGLNGNSGPQTVSEGAAEIAIARGAGHLLYRPCLASADLRSAGPWLRLIVEPLTLVNTSYGGPRDCLQEESRHESLS